MDNMSMNAGDTDSEVKNLLLQGFRAAKENRREEAYQLFCDVVARDPNNEHGWLYRAATTDSRSEAYVCLEKVLSINPDNQKAQRGLERIREQQQEESDAEDTDNAPTEAYMSGPTAAAAAAAQERIGGQEYVSNFPPGSKPAPTYGGYDAPAPAPRSAQSTYPFPVEEAAGRPTSYPGYSNSDPAPSNYPGYGAPPPPQGYPSYNPNPTADTQPRPSYNDNYQPAPSEADYGAAAAYGDEGATDLDRNGQERRRRTRSGLIVLIGLLLLIALILGAFLFLTRNNGTSTGLDQASIDATTTANAAASSGTTTPAAGITVTTVASNATTSAPVAGGTTAAGTNGTTAPGGAAATTAPASNPTQAPAGTSAAANPATQPAATTAAPPPATTAAASGNGSNNAAAPTKPILYTVRNGDSLYGIASRNGCSIDSIKAANRYTQPITGNSIFPSNRLIIPVGRPDFRGSGHIVAQGDTLDSIAAKYGTTADAIIKLNGLSGPTDFKVGDPLIIP